MGLSDLLAETAILSSLKVNSKKQCLQNMCEPCVRLRQQLTAREIFDVVLQREKLGSTGVGTILLFPMVNYRILTKS